MFATIIAANVAGLASIELTATSRFFTTLATPKANEV
jgi:hypothetical protein